MLEGQLQGVDIPVHAWTAHKGLLQKYWKRISVESSLMSRDWTDLHWTSRFLLLSFLLLDFLLFFFFSTFSSSAVSIYPRPPPPFPRLDRLAHVMSSCHSMTLRLHLAFHSVVPAGSPSRGGYVELTELAHSFLFCCRVGFCLCGPFNCIWFQKSFWQISAFLLCSSGLISALLVLSTICLLIWKSPSPLI